MSLFNLIFLLWSFSVSLILPILNIVHLYLMSPPGAQDFFFSASFLVARTNFLLSPDGNIRGCPLMPSIKYETPNLSCMNQR